MPIYGVDIHPEYQKGINIEAIRAEGFDFLAAKASEGTNASYMAAGSADWIRHAKACGLIPILYHYLRPGAEADQARVFADALRRNGVPGMLDAEALAGDGHTPTLTIAGIRRFLDACTRLGARVALLYLPRWYWDRLGRPSLAGLPPLWASSYVGGTGPARELYESVTPSRWADYGGNRAEVLQFSDRAQVAGRAIDVNHYRGTRAQFAALIGATPSSPRKETDPMVVALPATTTPADPRADPATWPQRNHDIPVFAGQDVCFGVQDWGERHDETRGFLALASWGFGGGKLVPIDPAFTTAGGGRPIARHWPTATYQVPPGAQVLTLNYAAPAGAYLGGA